jgi:DNA polymerase-3 subunit alpha
MEKLQHEKSVLGFYLSGHPTAIYLDEFQDNLIPIVALSLAHTQKVIICAQIVQFRKLETKKGKPFAILTLEDRTKSMEAVFFYDKKVEQLSLLSTGGISFFEGRVSFDEYSQSLRMMIDNVLTLAEVRQTLFKRLVINISSIQAQDVDRLASIIDMHRGVFPIVATFKKNEGEAWLYFSSQFQIQPSDDCLNSFRHLIGETSVYCQ